MKKLPKAPLKEVIFELRWDLEVDDKTQQEYDKGYELAQGKFQSLIKNKFKFYTRNLPREIPEHLLNYKTVHQFWLKENTWPVLQLGPGIFTMNDTDKNYVWEDTFFPLIQSYLKLLFKAYENKININFCNLKYIDAVKINDYPDKNNILNFVKNNLKIKLEHCFDINGILENININQTFKLKDRSLLNIVIANGTDKNTKEPMLIWQTAVFKKTVFKNNEILKWCKNAHSIISPLFKKMTKGDFYDSFK
jgi:uncharacterized protein (TIGR04255 family)